MPTIRFSTFPRTFPPAAFVAPVVQVFEQHALEIGTLNLDKGLTSNQVLTILRDDLQKLGFQVEGGKLQEQKIKRPVRFGDNGQPDLQYEVDAFHQDWK